jgi:transposase
MTLRAGAETQVSKETYEVAHAAFPKGNEYIRLRDELGEVFHLEEFADLYKEQGQEAVPPLILAWVTVLQFKEKWTDRDAAEQVRARIDVKYLLNLPLTYAGFHHSALGEFRERLLMNGAEERLLTPLLRLCQERGFVKAGGHQRSDSTPVLAVVRELNRLECVGESLRHALNEVAKEAPEWLQMIVPQEWYLWFGERIDASHLARSKKEASEWQVRIGECGVWLLTKLAEADAPAHLRKLAAVQILQMVWLQQYIVAQDKVRWRTEKEGLPSSKILIQSPYDPEARFRTKREVRWSGYMVHMSESCDDELPHLVTNVMTTPAATGDVEMTGEIHAALAAKGLLPAEHYVDSAFISAAHLEESHNRYELNLIGPVPVDKSWQAKAQQGYDVHSFAIDWQQQVVTCPNGKQSVSWQAKSKAGHPVVKIVFAQADCAPCPLRHACTKSRCRQLSLHPQPQHLALVAARQRQSSNEFRLKYKRRAGIEGTLSQAVRAFALRRTRYIGLAKTHLQHVATAAALNLARLADWLDPLYRREHQRSSFFARLAPAPL